MNCGEIYFHGVSFCFIRLFFFHYPFRCAHVRAFQQNVGLQKAKVMDKNGNSEREDGRQKGRMMIRGERERERKKQRERETYKTAAKRKRGIVLAEKARKLLTWFRRCFIRNSARWIMSVNRTSYDRCRKLLTHRSRESRFGVATRTLYESFSNADHRSLSRLSPPAHIFICDQIITLLESWSNNDRSCRIVYALFLSLLKSYNYYYKQNCYTQKS